MPGFESRSRHFATHEVADGVFSAIATDGGWAVGNAGFADLGDKTVVFDTFAHPEAALELRKEAERVSRRLPSFVVNSHPHRDHIRGNQVFPEASVVATVAARARMQEVWKAREAALAERGLAGLRRAAEVEFTDMRKGSAESAEDALLWDGYRDAIVQGLDVYRVRLPDLTFDRTLVIHGSKRTAELVDAGRGHSPGDAYLHVPEERVVFLGDLLFTGYQPYLGDGNPERLLTILDQVDRLDPETVIPGHGPPATRKDIGRLREYVQDILQVVAKVKESGGGVTEACASSVPAPFDTWRWQVFRRLNFEALLSADAP